MSRSISDALEYFKSYLPVLTYKGLIKTGKEAEVHLVSSDDEFYVIKIYKENNKYSSRFDYMPIESIDDTRLQRAFKHRTRTGRSRIKGVWTSREYKILKELGLYSENVPKVYAFTDNAILMEYLGTEASPAPRLKDVKLSFNEAKDSFNVIKAHIKLFVDMGFVHGDLSEYNILWFNNSPFFIDFPQFLEIGSNRNATDKFLKDIDNIQNYFATLLGDSVSRELSEIRDYYFIQLNS